MAGYKQGPGLSDPTSSVSSQVGLSPNQRVGNVAMGTTAGSSEFSGTAGSFGQEASAELTSSTGMGLSNPRATVGAQVGAPGQRVGNVALTQNQLQNGMAAQGHAKLDPSQEVSAFYEFSKEFGASRKNR